MLTNTNQVDTAIDQISDQDLPAPDPTGPQVPFPGSLVLTLEQEENLIEHVCRRLDQLELEQGRQISVRSGNQTSVPDKNTHFGKREMFTLRYQTYVEDRKSGAGPENPAVIYDVSNLTVGLSQRIAMQMAARANNYFFGTDPWFTISFVGTLDKPLAERIDRHAHWKFGESGLRTIGKKAVEYAFVRGEAVLKTTFLNNTRYYQRKGEALFDANGEPVLDVNGNYIFSDAKWVPQMALMPAPVALPAPGDPNQVLPGAPPDGSATPADSDDWTEGANAAAPSIDPTGGGGPMVMQATGRQVLKRDGVTVQPDNSTWQQGVWPLKRRIYQGTNCELVYYKDFLCPLDADDIHKADCIAHLYDLSVMDLVEMFKQQSLAMQNAKEAQAAISKSVTMLRNLASETDIPKSAARQARVESGEQSILGNEDNPSAEIAEVYVRYDANQDGLMEEIMLVLDRKNRVPVFYDYTDNVTVNGRRPFEVIRPKPVDGRWYGIGAMEYFQHEQEFIDLAINRRNFEQSASGRITFWDPSKTKEGSSSPGLKLRNGKTYTLTNDAKASEVLSYVTLPDTSEGMMELINFFMQIANLKSGMANTADGQMSGLPQPDTATGINDLSSSGEEMFSQFLDELEPGIEGTVEANLRVTYGNFNEAEYFHFSKGDVQMMDQLLPDDVADLDFSVTLLMTRKKTELSGQRNTQAWQIATQFYQLPPPVQQRLEPLAISLLKSKQVDDPGSFIKALTWAEMQAPQSQAPAGGPGSAAGAQQAAPAPALI